MVAANQTAKAYPSSAFIRRWDSHGRLRRPPPEVLNRLNSDLQLRRTAIRRRRLRLTAADEAGRCKKARVEVGASLSFVRTPNDVVDPVTPFAEVTRRGPPRRQFDRNRRADTEIACSEYRPLKRCAEIVNLGLHATLPGLRRRLASMLIEAFH